MTQENHLVDPLLKEVMEKAPNLAKRVAESLILDPIAGGTKYDGEKPRMDLLDPVWMEDVASVLTFGASKYAAHNWRGGINVSRLIAAAYRHLGAINNGEDIDPESGLPHSAHLSCCIMFLHWMLSNRKDLDDRWKPETEFTFEGLKKALGGLGE